MKKISVLSFAFCFFYFLCPTNFSAQAFWTEGFQNACSSLCVTYTGPNGSWTTTSTGTNDAQANIWYISGTECGNAAGTCGSSCGTSDPSLHIGPNDGTFNDAAAIYDAGMAFAVVSNIRAESPTISTLSMGNIVVSFNYIEGGDGTNDDATLWYFDGSTWTQIDALAKTSFGPCGSMPLWTAFSILLPPSANNNPNIKIGFNWTNNNDGIGTDPSFAVDDITIAMCGLVANAGPNQVLCGGNTVVNLNGNSSTTAGNWTTTGSGFFSNTSVLAPTYTVSPGDIAFGSVSLILTTANNAGCAAASDTVLVNLFSDPPVYGGADITACIGQNNTLTASGALTYLWSTGETTAAIVVSPAATTTYTVTGTDVNGCSASDPIMVTVGPNYNIDGQITYSLGNVTSGNVFLIAQGISSALYDTVATVSPNGSGMYVFTNVNAGNYYIRAESSLSPDFVNTYYGNEYLWDSANVVTHSCFTSTSFTNIAMIELTAISGPGSISGTVYEAAGFGQKLIQGNGPVIMTNVIPGVPVKIGKNPGGAIVASGITDGGGVYSFTNLPIDDYKVYVDLPGYPMDSSYAVSVTASNNSFVNLDYYADSNSVYIDLTTSANNYQEQKNNFFISTFPNPAQHNVTFVFDVNENSTATFELYNLQGEKIALLLNRNFEKGKYTQLINLDQFSLSNGTYMVKALVNNKQQFTRLTIAK